MACAICQTRRPRRFCPGVRGDICAVCCGTEREVTVNCPLDCEYLQAARQHEKAAPKDPSGIPNRDIRISEEFLEQHAELIAAIGIALAGAAIDTPGAVDFDIREALDSLVRTYRTLQTGVYYETRPTNPIAAQIYSAASQAVTAFLDRERKEFGITRTREADVLGCFVFLQRLEFDRNNGRRRGRAFVDMLRQFYGAGDASPVDKGSSLLLP